MLRASGSRSMEKLPRPNATEKNESVMYATQHFTTQQQPAVSGSICNRYLTLPPNARRSLEGGLRKHGLFKTSQPTKPLVSVITPVRNGGRTLLRAMLSILSQDYDNIEYIMIDGESSDSTHLHMLTYADAIDYFVSEPDAGLYDAINKGLSLASGDYILILNSDDWYDTHAVRKLVSAAVNGNAEVACALARTVSAEGLPTGSIPHFPYDDFVWLRMPLRHELMLTAKSVYERVGNYRTDYTIISDLEFVQRLFAAGVRVVEIAQELMSFRTNGLSSNMQALLEERDRLLQEHFPNLEEEERQLLCLMTPADCRKLLPLLATHKDDAKLCAAIRAYLRNCATSFTQ